MQIPQSNSFLALSRTKYRVEYATQVRRFFEKDLHCIYPGVCLLPEWICYGMTESALRMQHQLIFYRVNRMQESLIPLETDWSHVIDLIIQNERHHRTIIILVAFPLGYIDAKIEQLYCFLQEKRLAKVHLFMDLSQSYGSYLFLDDLDYANAVYISFNGQKLINSGGALRIALKGNHSMNFSLHELQMRINIALLEQKKSWQEIKSSIAKYWKGDCKGLMERLHVYNRISNIRSSYHRIALHIPIESSISQLLIQDGYGQTLHPHPQNYLWQMSFAYEELRKNTLLLFPYRRLALC